VLYAKRRVLLVCLNKVYSALDAKLALIERTRERLRGTASVLVLTWSAPVAARHRLHSVHWVPFGVDPAAFTLAAPRAYERRRHDVFFSGSLDTTKYPSRGAFVDTARRSGLATRVPRPHLNAQGYLTELNDTRMVLSTPGMPGEYDLIGTRYFEVLVSGGPLLLCERRAAHSYAALGIEENVTAVMFSTREELVRIARYYAAHTADAMAIVARARTLALARHSYAQRAEQVVSIVRRCVHEQQCIQPKGEVPHGHGLRRR
jgi:hypothetical protein